MGCVRKGSTCSAFTSWWGWRWLYRKVAEEPGYLQLGYAEPMLCSYHWGYRGVGWDPLIYTPASLSFVTHRGSAAAVDACPLPSCKGL